MQFYTSELRASLGLRWKEFLKKKKKKKRKKKNLIFKLFLKRSFKLFREKNSKKCFLSFLLNGRIFAWYNFVCTKSTF
jgi:hypothetical protein